MQMDPVGWSDVNAWLIREINYVLDRSYFVDSATVSSRWIWMTRKDDPGLMILKKQFLIDKIVAFRTRAKDSRSTHPNTPEVHQLDH